MNKHLLMSIMLTALPLSAMAVERDPFTPYISDNASAVEESAPTPLSSQRAAYPSNIVELDKYPVSSFKLIGVVIAPEESLAVVRAVDKNDYFIKVGQILGKEKGTVSSITQENMVVEVKDKLITLKVSNKLGDKENEKAM